MNNRFRIRHKLQFLSDPPVLQRSSSCAIPVSQARLVQGISHHGPRNKAYRRHHPRKHGRALFERNKALQCFIWNHDRNISHLSRRLYHCYCELTLIQEPRTPSPTLTPPILTTLGNPCNNHPIQHGNRNLVVWRSLPTHDVRLAASMRQDLDHFLPAVFLPRLLRRLPSWFNSLRCIHQLRNVYRWPGNSRHWGRRHRFW